MTLFDISLLLLLIYILWSKPNEPNKVKPHKTCQLQLSLQWAQKLHMSGVYCLTYQCALSGNVDWKKRIKKINQWANSFFLYSQLKIWIIHYVLSKHQCEGSLFPECVQILTTILVSSPQRFLVQVASCLTTKWKPATALVDHSHNETEAVI